MAAWRIVDQGTDVNGAPVEMRYAEFGSGRHKVKKWELFRNDKKVGYAATAADAEVNFGRVKAGLTHNADTGRYG